MEHLSRPIGRLVAGIAFLSVLGCAEADRRPAPPPGPPPTARADRLALTALGGRWAGFPPDLERYYVPIEAIVVNDRADPVPLALTEFRLIDASGRERQAVPPPEATTYLFGTYGRRSALDGPAAVQGAVATMPGGAAVVPARAAFFFSGRFAIPLYGGYPYDYPYYAYPYPPPYSTPSYAQLTGDLLRFGLAESRVEKHGYVRGFLYFERGDGPLEEPRVRWSPSVVPTPLEVPVAGTPGRRRSS